MGDTHRDPIDHHRTALPYSGATFKDFHLIPRIELPAIVSPAMVSGTLGVVAIALESRRVHRIDARWHANISSGRPLGAGRSSASRPQR